MSIKVTIKLDSSKIRVYIESNDVTIDAIESYLKIQDYKKIADCMNAEGKTQEQKPTGYSLPNYSLAYQIKKTEGIKTLGIEAWFKIATHYNSISLGRAIESLIKPILPPVTEDIIHPQPNISVYELRNRHYNTVFEQDDARLDDVLTLVQNFESIVLDVRKQVGLQSYKIPSEVNVYFDPVHHASHAKGLSVFGLMSVAMSSSNASSAPSASTNYAAHR